MSVLFSYRFVAAAVMFAALSTRLLAQTTARVSGAISDASNAVIPSARVTITNVDTGIQRGTV